MMSPAQCQQARLARDNRYDGLFFTAVKTTGIYCRSICPAPSPLEKNVEYFDSAFAAAQAGYRPCLRCRPDSAPGSPAWRGKNATLTRAMGLIEQGDLAEHSLSELAARLGVSDRYLRQLFVEEIGLSPKAYSLYNQCLLAKKLLHETNLPITQLAYACGFNSIRRFNDCFKKQFSLSPSALRKENDDKILGGKAITISLSYRPPYNWQDIHDFFASRLIEGLEWLGDDYYGRTINDGLGTGWFTARHQGDKARFLVEIQLSELTELAKVIANIRRCLDLDADSTLIESRVGQAVGMPQPAITGLRLPGVWSPFEAGIRAILGQQVSVKAARNLVAKLVAMNPDNQQQKLFFPRPAQFGLLDLDTLGMPQRRRETIKTFAAYACEHDLHDSQALLALPGIGPWTVNYLRMRGISDPDIFLEGDLGVKKAIAKTPCKPELAAPWRSYLTLYLWNTLS
ncbi:DNA-3-methyladenine glycosylase 2 family protein [Photobacterium sanctipauli]|uniref:DNA-3-methyladenine glycosylase II n=1 Tax=Photobacterium sanctipauli TaxID=1342794 RepID=A0A2T3NP13_9GAMM|nr:AlkA N-terminal domain-containing protein [Photobacterium sanctipauli]PSW18013.1 DNA-3-methyladenine glycosylase 2 family protein [Photobacterium sanctipauli]